MGCIVVGGGGVGNSVVACWRASLIVLGRMFVCGLEFFWG